MRSSTRTDPVNSAAMQAHGMSLASVSCCGSPRGLTDSIQTDAFVFLEYVRLERETRCREVSAQPVINENDCRSLDRDSRRSQAEVIHPSLMPGAALHLAGDMLAIRRWLWWTRKCVPRVVAASACGHDVLSRVPSALALRNQVLRSAAKPLPSRAVARGFRQFVGGRQPHSNVAVVAAPTLLFEGTTTMNLDSIS